MRRVVFSVAVGICCFTACWPVGQVAARQRPVEEPIVSRVAITPPPPRQEVITAAPAGKAVWVAGSWDRTPDVWEWMAGGWAQPPTANAVWMPGGWQLQRGGFVWVDAQWVAAKMGLIVPAPPAIPLAFPETPVAAPKSKRPVVWQGGHWEWRGTWVWEPGMYIESVIPNATWVLSQWEKMADGSWRWTPAHWEHAR